MPKAVEQTNSGLTIGHALLGLSGANRMTVKQAVHDGDTVNVDPLGNLSVRFLGIDTPEVSFTLPGHPPTSFIPIKNAEWTTFLTDPFAAGIAPFDPLLPAGLETDLRARVGASCAPNHAKHAEGAHRRLETIIEGDRTQSGETLDSFEFFLAFANDVIDRYGRFLGYLNRSALQGQRPPSYNERLVAEGLAVPYFIWPNIDPFRRQPSLLDAVPEPSKTIKSPKLDQARQMFAKARLAKRGLFEAGNSLMLLPFELRFLARTSKKKGKQVRTGPDRWVIDLSQPSNQLLAPHRYFEIRNWEDRMFVPSEYVPLFMKRGWKEAA